MFSVALRARILEVQNPMILALQLSRNLGFYTLPQVFIFFYIFFILFYTLSKRFNENAIKSIKLLRRELQKYKKNIKNLW